MWDSVVGGVWVSLTMLVNETQTFFMASENITQAKTKKIKRLLSESKSEHKTNENFYQFIVLKSIEEIPITKLSPIPNSKNNRNGL